MKVFLSCSGKLSMEIGKVLRETLPMLLQALQPFLSVEDIKLGDFWVDAIEDIIADCECAIICLTKSNLSSPWVYYEAGVLSGKKKSIIPLLIDITYDELAQTPLCAYQAVTLEKESMFSLIQDLNKKLDPPLSGKFLDKFFSAIWPTIDEMLQNTIANCKRESAQND